MKIENIAGDKTRTNKFDIKSPLFFNLIWVIHVLLLVVNMKLTFSI